MTVTILTMNFKNSVLDIAKRMVAENISSIAITDDKRKSLVSSQNQILSRSFPMKSPLGDHCRVFNVLSATHCKK
jgi:predicted transcriptional regulator